ncbi:hypothetical protein ACOY72_00330 [Acinetobacter seifertii]|uniref:Uncharacterized protein n=1 Tax=Acinetobacter seifertii TaxID=1530123 RepID=N8QUV3_9GAMM|nr:hypothetical protein [Acinetobacter seifertii]ENU42405.1 hypothetical protein F985_03294 [Acinetobacter seifertii]
MDICIGGILNGKVCKNNENYFSAGNPHSDEVTKYEKQYFHLNGKLLSFWVCSDIKFQEALQIAESFIKKKKDF